MKLSGYPAPSHTGACIAKVAELNLEVSIREIKQLADFFSHCAAEAEKLGSKFDHRHFRDWLGVTDESVPELVAVLTPMNATGAEDDEITEVEKPLTYSDYSIISRLEHEPRFELIAGRIVPLVGTGRRHQRVVGELAGQISGQLRGRRCELFIAPFDVRLPRPGQAANDANDVVQPDLMVFCNPANHDERGGLCAPEFVIEVLSPSGGAHDMVRKRRIYETHCVLEYWIVDPISEVVHIHRLREARYAHESAEWEPSMAVTAVDGLSLDLAVLRDVLRDEAS